MNIPNELIEIKSKVLGSVSKQLVLLKTIIDVDMERPNKVREIKDGSVNKQDLSIFVCVRDSLYAFDWSLSVG